VLKHIREKELNLSAFFSDPKVLLDKLKILLAQKDAGNNNVFIEISAISDELRRNGVLSLKQLKNLYKKLH